MGFIADTALDYDGYTGDVWSVNTVTNTANFSGNVSISDNLSVSGNAAISGNLTFGNADTDTVALSSKIVSNITNDADATYDLGLLSKSGSLHVQDINISGDGELCNKVQKQYSLVLQKFTMMAIIHILTM